jgi:calreticulin
MATYSGLGVVGFELWTVNNGTIFDNVLITDDVDYAKKVAEELWMPLSEGEKAKKEAWSKARQAEREAAEKKAEKAKKGEPTVATLSEEAVEEIKDEL